MSYQKMKELEKRSSQCLSAAVVMMGLLLFVGAYAIGTQSILGTIVGAILMIIMLTLLGYEQRYDDQAHAIRLQLGHIHRNGCEQNDLITVVETETHQTFSMGVWADNNPSSITVVDSETTECPACKSRTRFERGQPPRLLESG